VSSRAKDAFEVIILGNRCKECGLCINLCPMKVLETGSKTNKKGFYTTIPAHPEKCIGCSICEYICPDYAIFIRRLPEGKSIGKVVWDGGVDIYEG